MASKGDIRLIISDPGSQLVCAAKELSAWRKNWDLEELIRFGADKGLTWHFIIANSRHQNVAAESLIKVVKGIVKSLMRVVGDTKLSLKELNNLLAECANLANERPVGLKPNTQTDSEYLSPNSLQLGRSSSRISLGSFTSADSFSEDPKYARTRFHLVQTLTLIGYRTLVIVWILMQQAKTAYSVVMFSLFHSLLNLNFYGSDQEQ